MSLPKAVAACCAFWACCGAWAQPGKVTPNPNVLLEPVTRIGDTRILFPTATVAFSPDGKTLLAADYSSVGNVVAVDVASRKARGHLRGHDTYINQFAFSPDSRHAFSGPHPYGAGLATPAGTVIQWDLSTHKELWKLPATAWDLSADGKLLVTLQSRYGVKDARESIPPSYTLTFYHVASRKPLREITVTKSMASVVAFSPDGKRVAYADAECKIRVLDVTDQFKEVRAIQAPRDEKAFTAAVAFLAWSPDSKRLASVSDDQIRQGAGERVLCLWDPATGRLSWQAPVAKTRVWGLAFSPDGKKIVTDGGAFAAASGKPLQQPGPHGDGPLALAMYRDGKVPADGADVPPLIRDLWDRATGVDVASGTHPDRLLCMAFAPDGKTLATGEGGGLIRLWSLPDGKEVKRLWAGEWQPRPRSFWRFSAPPTKIPPRRDSVSHLSFLDSAKAEKAIKAALATLNDEWEREKKKALARLPADADEDMKRIAVRRIEGPYEWNSKALQGLKDLSAGMLITTHWSGEIRLWNARTGEYLEVGDGWSTGQSATVAAGLRLLLGKGGRIYEWPSEAFIETEPTRVAQLLPVPNTSYVVALAGFGEPPVLVDLKRKKVLHKFGSINVASASVSPNGKTLATYGRTTLPGRNEEDGRVRLYDVVSGKEWGQLAKDPPAGYGVWFAPGGYSVLVQHQDGLRLWELASRQQRAFIKDTYCNVAFSRDGRLLVTLPNYHKHVKVWDLTGRQQAGALDQAPLSPEEFRPLWNDLAGKDAKKAYAAIWRLAAAAEQAVPLLAQKTEQMPGLDRQRVPALIAALDSPRFVERDRAMKELPRFGRWAQAALAVELGKSPPIERKRRLEQLLYKLQEEPYTPEQILALRIVEALERMDTPASRQLLARLRDGDKPQFSEAAGEALARR
jgi:WD40 repeat protein